MAETQSLPPDAPPERTVKQSTATEGYSDWPEGRPKATDGKAWLPEGRSLPAEGHSELTAK